MVREVKCQVWLAEDGRPLLGEEGAALLFALRERGSIDTAAQTVGMTREGAADMIGEIEAAIGTKAVAGTSEVTLTAHGEALLQEYQNKKCRVEEQVKHLFRNPTLTADGIVLMDGRIVLVKRGKEPGKGMYALPGGFVEYGEKTEDCVVREVLEETGLRTEVLDLVGSYSDPARDPRGHLVSLVYFLRATGGELRGGDDAEKAAIFDISHLPRLAFDHSLIIDDFRRWAGKDKV